MRVAVLFSGGKDSTYAAFLAKNAGHELACLVTVFPENPDSFMFHWPALELTKQQAALIGVRHVAVQSKGEKEAELADLKNALKELDVEGVVSGAVASEYQKKRVDKLCADLKLKHFALLWAKNQKSLLLEQLRAGFESIITRVAAAGFDETWLGRRIDEACVKDLEKLNKKYGVSLNGEGGEYESLVLNCPLFAQPLKTPKFKRVWLGDRGHLEPASV